MITFLFLCVPSVAESPDDGASANSIGKEVAVERHLRNGEEFELSIPRLIAFGKRLFEARWTIEEGAGRPFAKGTASGPRLADPTHPLLFPRNFNRLSGPDANSCSGCHNLPGIGGGGDRATLVFVLGQRFDFLSFDHSDAIATRGAVDERNLLATLQTLANERKTISLHGSGYIELLAREMTADLQTIRDSMVPGSSRPLVTKGLSFGTLLRRPDGTWDTAGVQGLPAPSLASQDASRPPSLILMPFHQSGSAVSLRQFTNNALHQHHGIQAAERFGPDVDEDGDGFVNEVTRADVTAMTLFQATLPVPGRVVPKIPEIDAAVTNGERLFHDIGCAECHVPKLPLRSWIYTEPNPYNPPGNLQTGNGPTLSIDLSSDDLPGPRLKPDANNIVWVPAFTDLRLHDITSGPDDPNAEPLDQNQPVGSASFFGGNRKFITRKLWGTANSGPFMHHGKFTTMREAVLAHAGEALVARQRFEALSKYDRDSVIEFLKTLQVLARPSRE